MGEIIIAKFVFSTAAWHAVSYAVLHNYMSLKQTKNLGLAKKYITYFWLYPENNKGLLGNCYIET